MTDYPITAARAYEIGPVNRVVPDGALVGALEMAAAIAANGPVFESTDAREGAAAFAEKRTARWTGR